MRWSLALLVTACAQAEVHWEMWTSAGDDAALIDLFHADYANGEFDFTHSFKDTYKALGAQQSFIPRFVIQDGSTGQFAAADCTNGGRYCSNDPDADPSRGLSGADVVTENLRRICLWTIHGTAKWWDYVSAFSTRCNTAETFADGACYEQAMEAAGVGSAGSGSVAQCMSKADLDDGTNDLLVNEMHQAASDGVTAVAIRVGGGALDVRPRTRAAVLSAICDQYGAVDDADHEPAVCACAAAASDGAYDACVAPYASVVAHGGGKPRGAPAQDAVRWWAVLLIVAGVVAIMLLGGFVYWKRTQSQMREQVRGILAEYMPLDEDGGVPGSKQFNIQSDGGALV